MNSLSWHASTQIASKYCCPLCLLFLGALSESVSNTTEELVIAGSAKLHRQNRKFTGNFRISSPSEDAFAFNREHEDMFAAAPIGHGVAYGLLQKTASQKEVKLLDRPYLLLQKTLPLAVSGDDHSNTSFGIISCCMVAIAFCSAAAYSYKSFRSDETVLPHVAEFRYVRLQFALTCALQSASVTVIVPTSYGISKDMGYGAAESGALIGSAYMCALLYASALQPFMRSWSQPLMKTFSVCCHFAFALFALVYCFGACPPTWWLFQSGSARFYSCCVARALSNCVGAGYYIMYMMSFKMIEKDDWTHLTLLKISASIAGNAVGPLISSFIDFVLNPTNLQERAAWPMFALSMIGMIFGLTTYLYTPDQLNVAYLPDNQDDQDNDHRSEDHNRLVKNSRVSHRRSSLLDGRSLPVSVKQSIWLIALLCSTAGSLVGIAVESTSALILESDFSWTTRKIGVICSLSLSAGLPVCLLSLFNENSWHTDVRILRFAIVLCALSSMLFSKSLCGMLLDVDSPWPIVAADVVIYPAMYMTHGILEALALKVSMPGTLYSLENYTYLHAAQNCIFCSAGPILSRFVVNKYGRDGYAGLQFTFLAFCLFYVFFIPARKDPHEQLEDLIANADLVS